MGWPGESGTPGVWGGQLTQQEGRGRLCQVEVHERELWKQGKCQYFSRTASDKLGHLQYFLSKLGYPPCCCGHPRALGSWVTQKWSSPCPAPSGIPASRFRALTRQASSVQVSVTTAYGMEPIFTAGHLPQTTRGAEAFLTVLKKKELGKRNDDTSSPSTFMFYSLERQNNGRKVCHARGGEKSLTSSHIAVSR